MSDYPGELPSAVIVPPDCLRQLVAQINKYQNLDRRYLTSHIPRLIVKSNIEWTANNQEGINPAYNAKLPATSTSNAAEKTLAWQEQKVIFHLPDQ